MRSIKAYDFGDFRFEQSPDPETGNDGLVIKVAYSGICGSDRVIYENRAPWELNFPYIPGHEFCGEVAEIGPEFENTRNLKIGEKITAELILTCSTCRFCQAGRYNLCDNALFLGSSLDGGWAEYMRIPSGARIHRIPDSVDLINAALIEPLSCSTWAVERSHLRAADTVVICGLGPIGMGAVAAARLKNPLCIIALDVDERLFDIAGSIGADFVLNPHDDHFKENLICCLGGRGISVFIEASGSSHGLVTGIDLVEKGGKVIVYGVYAEKTGINWSVISEFKELEIIGGHLAPGMFPVVINRLAQKKLDPGPLISGVFQLERFKEALEAKNNSKEPVIKMLLNPGIG